MCPAQIRMDFGKVGTWWGKNCNNQPQKKQIQVHMDFGLIGTWWGKTPKKHL